LGVFRGVAGGENLQRESVMTVRQVFQHQHFAIHLEGRALTVHQHARQIEFFAVQSECLRGHIGVAAHLHGVEHPCFVWIQVEHQFHLVDPEGGYLVVFTPGQHGLSFTHQISPV
jgi:hypothetical protein